MSNIWKPKTSGMGEHDFLFNVPPPTFQMKNHSSRLKAHVCYHPPPSFEGKLSAHADGPKKITPDLLVYGVQSPTAKKVKTNWEDKWFSRRERESTFIYEWTVYKSDPPPL